MRITPRRQAGEAYTGFFGFCVIAPDTEVVKVPGFKSETGASNLTQAPNGVNLAGGFSDKTTL